MSVPKTPILELSTLTLGCNFDAHVPNLVKTSAQLVASSFVDMRCGTCSMIGNMSEMILVISQASAVFCPQQRTARLEEATRF